MCSIPIELRIASLFFFIFLRVHFLENERWAVVYFLRNFVAKSQSNNSVGNPSFSLAISIWASRLMSWWAIRTLVNLYVQIFYVKFDVFLLQENKQHFVWFIISAHQCLCGYLLVEYVELLVMPRYIPRAKTYSVRYNFSSVNILFKRTNNEKTNDVGR